MDWLQQGKRSSTSHVRNYESGPNRNSANPGIVHSTHAAIQQENNRKDSLHHRGLCWKRMNPTPYDPQLTDRCVDVRDRGTVMTAQHSAFKFRFCVLRILQLCLLIPIKVFLFLSSNHWPQWNYQLCRLLRPPQLEIKNCVTDENSPLDHIARKKWLPSWRLQYLPKSKQRL